MCMRCVSGGSRRDGFAEDVAQVWLTRLNLTFVSKIWHGHVWFHRSLIRATWSTIYMFLVFFWCGDVWQRGDFACPRGTSLYCPSHRFELKGHCVEIRRVLVPTASSTRRYTIDDTRRYKRKALIRFSSQIATAVSPGQHFPQASDWKAS